MTRCLPRCLPAAQSARIHAQRLKNCWDSGENAFQETYLHLAVGFAARTSPSRARRTLSPLAKEEGKVSLLSPGPRRSRPKFLLNLRQNSPAMRSSRWNQFYRNLVRSVMLLARLLHSRRSDFFRRRIDAGASSKFQQADSRYHKEQSQIGISIDR
jgi:hypothetical protein